MASLSNSNFNSQGISALSTIVTLPGPNFIITHSRITKLTRSPLHSSGSLGSPTAFPTKILAIIDVRAL
jgi:hypothetical protein